MNPMIKTVIEALNEFIAVENDSENVERLYEIFDGFRMQPDREKALPAMFAVIERFPEADLGSPGPMVHELEAIDGYQPLLRASLHRQPTDLSVWMVNRILNSDSTPLEREIWLEEMRLACVHPLCPISTRESVLEFLEYQDGKA